MDTYQKILVIEDKLEAAEDKDACSMAEKTLFNMIYNRIQQVTSKDVIASMMGQPVKKQLEPIDYSAGMEALKTIHELGLRCGIRSF